MSTAKGEFDWYLYLGHALSQYSTASTMSGAHELQAAALLGHIASQMQLNVAFLESQNYLSPQDAATMKEIIGRLPVQTQTSVATTTQVKVVSAPALGGRAIPPPPRQVTAMPSGNATVLARAVWGYNENGAVWTSDYSCLGPRLTTSHDRKQMI